LSTFGRVFFFDYLPDVQTAIFEIDFFNVGTVIEALDGTLWKFRYPLSAGLSTFF
jgi:hypothetical protein